MSTSTGSQQQLPGVNLLGNQNFEASHIYSGPYSNVYDNSFFCPDNRRNRQTKSCDNLGTQYNDQLMKFSAVNDWFMPRPGIPKFDLNPWNYNVFINGFEKHFESKISYHQLLCAISFSIARIQLKKRFIIFLTKVILDTNSLKPD